MEAIGILLNICNHLPHYMASHKRTVQSLKTTYFIIVCGLFAHMNNCNTANSFHLQWLHSLTIPQKFKL
jgi:hypothetical protein